MSIGNLVHVRKTECARAYDPMTGDVIVLSHVKYNVPHYATGSDEEFYVERIHNGEVVSASGWESEQQALEHITGHPDDESSTIVFGTEVKRPGLGVPDGMMKRSQYSFTSEEARKANEQTKRDRERAEQDRQNKEMQDRIDAAVRASSNAQTPTVSSEATNADGSQQSPS